MDQWPESPGPQDCNWNLHANKCIFWLEWYCFWLKNIHKIRVNKNLPIKKYKFFSQLKSTNRNFTSLKVLNIAIFGVLYAGRCLVQFFLQWKPFWAKIFYIHIDKWITNKNIKSLFVKKSLLLVCKQWQVFFMFRFLSEWFDDNCPQLVGKSST